MNDDKELQIQSLKDKKKKKKKTPFKNRIFVQENIHPKKKIVSSKDLLCHDNQQKSSTNSKQCCKSNRYKVLMQTIRYM